MISSYPALQDTSPSEALVVKSLRQYVPDRYDIRMILATGPKNGPPGGYEIRRRDWESVVSSFSTFSRASWQAKTLYVVSGFNYRNILHTRTKWYSDKALAVPVDPIHSYLSVGSWC